MWDGLKDKEEEEKTCKDTAQFGKVNNVCNTLDRVVRVLARHPTDPSMRASRMEQLIRLILLLCRLNEVESHVRGDLSLSLSNSLWICLGFGRSLLLVRNLP